MKVEDLTRGVLLLWNNANKTRTAVTEVDLLSVVTVQTVGGGTGLEVQLEGSRSEVRGEPNAGIKYIIYLYMRGMLQHATCIYSVRYSIFSACCCCC
jgi:hypothetical protein